MVTGAKPWIAEKLDITENTVKIICANIMEKCTGASASRPRLRSADRSGERTLVWRRPSGGGQPSPCLASRLGVGRSCAGRRGGRLSGGRALLPRPSPTLGRGEFDSAEMRSGGGSAQDLIDGAAEHRFFEQRVKP